MSTRKTAAHALAQRCKAVGWTVSNPRGIAGAYRVTMAPCESEDCNHIVQIHLTSSDVNAEKTITRELKRHGIEGLERKIAKVRDTERLKRIEAGRADAERKAAELLKQAKSINRAAGPYAGPELVDDAWMLNPHPAPAFKWVIVTPEQAARIAKTINTNNRPLSESQIDHYRGVIVSNQWRQTHQGMAVDTDGVLQDGQHRLWAISRAGIAVPVAFFVGMDPDNFKAIDEGLVRTAAQLFSRSGESYTVVMAGMMKLLYAMSGDNARRDYRAKLTNEIVYDMFGDDQEQMRLSVDFGGRFAKRAHANATAMAAAHYLIRKANGRDNRYVAAFFNGYIKGRKGPNEALHPYDPRLRLREYMMNARSARKRINSLSALALTILTWNYVVSDYRPQNLRFTDSMNIPRITLCLDDSRLGISSHCPALLEGEVRDRDEDDEEEQAA